VATHGGNPEKQDGSHEPECIHVLGLRVKTSARGKRTFFPTASERRVLLIVGGCQTFYIFTSSHPHILTSSHIFTSSLLLFFTSFTSSHLHILITSSHLHILTHLHIFTSSHLHILSCPLALSFFSILF
jgi:hypothetical protein